MAKRPTIDLSSITEEAAAPMQEATQRAPQRAMPELATGKTANLEGLSFKVSPEFRKRFKLSAADSGMKLNELLFACYAAWEKGGKH